MFITKDLMIKKINTFINREFTLSLNWAYILIFVLFWSYGYIGAVGLKSLIFQLGLAAYIVATTTYFLFLGANKKELITSKFTFLIKDILVLGAMIAFWITIAFDKLSQPIAGDHFAYSLGAIEHEFYSIIILNKFLNIEDIVFKDAIYILDLLIIVSVAIFIFLSRFIKFKLIWTSILISTAILIFRYTTISQGAGMNPHPPLQLFPISLSAGIFGLSDFSLRFAQYIGLITCSFMIYLTSIRRFGRINSFFVATALCAIPLLIYVATLIEASIWTSILWILLLIQIPLFRKQNYIYWFGLISLVSIFVMLRITAFIAYPIILILFLKYQLPSILDKKLDFAFVASPFLVCLPFLLSSIFFGTPAIISAGSEGLVSDHYFIFNHALFSGILRDIILSTMNASWLFLLPAIFIKFKNEQNYWFNRFIIILFFSISLIMFFSTRPEVWSNDRYQAEFLLPFIILGGYLFFSKIQSISKLNLFIPLLSIISIYFGLVGFYDYPNNIHNRHNEKTFMIQTENIYDYKSALTAAKEAGLAKNTLLVGWVYGVMPQVLSDFTIEEVIKSHERYKKSSKKEYLGFTDLKSATPELVNKELDIKLVLISKTLLTTANKKTNLSNVYDGDILRSGLLLLGWSDWKKFTSDSNNVIYGIIRDN